MFGFGSLGSNVVDLAKWRKSHSAQRAPAASVTERLHVIAIVKVNGGRKARGNMAAELAAVAKATGWTVDAVRDLFQNVVLPNMHVRYDPEADELRVT